MTRQGDPTQGTKNPDVKEVRFIFYVGTDDIDIIRLSDAGRRTQSVRMLVDESRSFRAGRFEVEPERRQFEYDITIRRIK